MTRTYGTRRVTGCLDPANGGVAVVVEDVVWGSLLLAWFITARIKGPVFLPTPFATAKGLGKLVTEGYVPTIAGSLRQLFAGFAIAVAVGVPTGLLMGSVRAADDFLSPYVNTLFIVSKEALLPLFIVLFGTHFIFRVAVVFFFSILFIVLNTAAGVRSVDSRLSRQPAHSASLVARSSSKSSFPGPCHSLSRGCVWGSPRRSKGWSSLSSG